MKLKLLFALCLATTVIAGCGRNTDESAQNGSTASAVETAPRSTPRTAPEPDRTGSESPAVEEDVPLIAAPRLTGASPVPGDGLNLVIFASDRREYNESLRMIAEQTSDEQFQQLDAALRYLMINDPSIMNDEQRLFDAIDGKTGMEILQMTSDLLNNRRM